MQGSRTYKQEVVQMKWTTNCCGAEMKYDEDTKETRCAWCGRVLDRTEKP